MPKIELFRQSTPELLSRIIREKNQFIFLALCRALTILKALLDKGFRFIQQALTMACSNLSDISINTAIAEVAKTFILANRHKNYAR